MPIAIITIREDDTDDTIDISVEFEPPVKNGDDDENPLTHGLAMALLDYAGKILGGDVRSAKVDGKEVDDFRFDDPPEVI